MWGYFDGASQGQPVKCEGGAVLRFSGEYFFHFYVGLGAGTNNFAELFTLKLLFLFTLENGCMRLQVFGDSMIILNWIKELQCYHTMRLVPILYDALDIKNHFENITFTLVYRERNGLEYRISKEGT